MRITEVEFDGSRPVDSYGPGCFRIAGERVEGAMFMSPSGMSAWGGYDDIAPLLENAGQFDVLLVGTGSQIAHIPATLRAALEGAGVGVEAMASPAACRTYNVLLSEGRRVGLAVLPVA